MATSHLITGRYIPQFSLNSLIFIFSFGEIFSYFATSWKWYYLTFWIGKKSRLFRRFFQYSVICHSSKYIRLALTDFSKKGCFIGITCGYNWAQFKTKIHRRKREKIHCQFCFLCSCWRHKYWKTLTFSFERAQITWAFVLCTRAVVKLQGATLTTNLNCKKKKHD